MSSCVSLGMFDGIHLGHKEVIMSAVNLSAEFGLTPAVFTFRTPPKNVGCIIPYTLKTDIMRSMGIREIYAPEFDEVKNLSADDFVNGILIEKMDASVIICGWNFRFSKDAAADTETLKNICGPLGVRVEVIPPISADGVTVSSTVIRSALKNGEIARVNKLLGYEIFYRFLVVKGQGLGTKIGIPTINQQFPKQCLIPKFGVYKSVVSITGTARKSITNIGVRPTVGGLDEPIAETHIIGFCGDLYGETVDVHLTDFVREERKFESLDELKTQIEKDIKIW